MSTLMPVPDDLARTLASADMTAEELADVLDQAVATTRLFSAVPQADRDIMLAESGLDEDGKQQVEQRWASQGRASIEGAVRTLVATRLRGDWLTSSEAATRSGVSPSTVTRWAAAHELVSTRDARGRLSIPAWQFTEAGPLPGWDIVAPVFAGVDVRTVESFVDAEQDELDGLSALEWLSAGRDPHTVAALATSVISW